MIEEMKGRLDFGALRDAIERKDPEALLGFYSEDAELRIVHEALPEGRPFELKGKAQKEVGKVQRAVGKRQKARGE